MPIKILIDECLPKRLKVALSEHSIFTVPEMGWAGKKDGELLVLMAGKFDVFLTIDQNLEYQQNIGQRAVAFVVLVAANSKMESLLPLIPEFLRTLPGLQAGTVTKIHAP